ncbi:MAG: Ni/Fe-hydrogenase, b-type cytochrome subunit [Bacillota bacterium]|nr:Ni/Fe-hydrogenase, b-type cytochrome subunit [Bacillota bacterium]
MILRHTLAVRFFHWWNAVSIIMLILTGFYIHTPYGFPIFSSMDVARKIHFIFMYAVIAGLVGRLYYAFISGDSRNFKPRFRDIPNMIALMKYYTFLSDELPDWGEKYNPGQKMMYAGFVPLLIIQIVTGFILYWPTALNHWAVWLGGPIAVRYIHYIVAWVFVYCVAAHLYLDITEGIANIIGIISGHVPEDLHSRHRKHSSSFPRTWSPYRHGH